MRRGIWTAAALLAGCLVFSPPAAAQADETYVFDYAQLLSDSEERELQELAEELVGRYDMNFVLLTIDDAEGKDSEAYADDFYMDQGFYDDGKKGGAIYLIDMDNRQVQMETAGDMLYLYITDSRVDDVIDAGYDELKDGAYAECFENMLNQTADFIDDGVVKGKNVRNRDTGEYWEYEEPKKGFTFFDLLIILVPALIAWVVTYVSIVGKYRLKWGNYKYPYKEKAGLKLERSRDEFVGRHTTHRHIDRGNHGDGGNSGSTTSHTSSGGGSFGGGGRGF